MTSTKHEDLQFLHPVPLSMRAISQSWVKKRGAVINPEEPDTEAALHEALEHIAERMGDNMQEGTIVRMFPPENDEDPYILIIPVDLRSSAERRKELAASKPAETTEVRFSDRSSLREDFESLLLETIEDMSPNRLERKENGDYYDKRILGMWKGFTLYHRGCSVAKRTTLPPRYHCTLGRYVVAKIDNSGSAFFTKLPFRHSTKVQAIEEASRLNLEFNAPFGIFRCLDIIDVKLNNGPIELTEKDQNPPVMEGINIATSPIFNEQVNPNHYIPQVDEPSPFGALIPNAWLDWHRAGNKSQIELKGVNFGGNHIIFLEEVGKSLLYETLRTSEQIGDEPSLMTDKGELSMAWVIWAYYTVAKDSTWEQMHAVGQARIAAM